MDAVRAEDWIYVVTDIEVDGFTPGPNSMRSFASVAVSTDGTEYGRFEAVLEQLPGAAPNPDNLAWFAGFPEAWAAATTDPRPIPEVMERFTDWVANLGGPTVFAACPIAFDGTWIDYYLRRFTRHGLVEGPYTSDPLFPGGGLCLRSYAAAVSGRPVAEISGTSLPKEWLGDVEHTHKAIDDALGYANLLVTLSRKAGATG